MEDDDSERRVAPMPHIVRAIIADARRMADAYRIWQQDRRKPVTNNQLPRALVDVVLAQHVAHDRPRAKIFDELVRGGWFILDGTMVTVDSRPLPARGSDASQTCFPMRESQIREAIETWSLTQHR